METIEFDSIRNDNIPVAARKLYGEILDSLDMWKALKDISPQNSHHHKEEFGMCIIEMVLEHNKYMWYYMTQNSSLGKILRTKEFSELKKEVVSTFAMLSVVVNK